ncbi:metal-dependent hydrolase [Gammaproteobacteria bacterium 45_16_T64]|nr:metal-dependent hydrolase [Gammaproteobacteria bacterium 45_16_T64]
MKKSIMPTRRSIQFKLPANRITDWHRDGINVSQYMNTMSVFLPVGERFFIDSVRHFRDQIQDPELTKAVTAFIGQEAMHGREHEELNTLLEATNTPAKEQEAIVTGLLNFGQKVLPKKHQLAVTIGLEHLTGLLADSLLRTPESVEGSEANYVAMWNWHALEETEHKAVAYDVYQAVMPDSLSSYAIRTFWLVAATGVYFSLQYPFYIENVRREKALLDIGQWRSGLSFLWGKKGLKSQCVTGWFDWFRPGFHPWDHDNEHHLSKFDELLGEHTDKTLKSAA